MLQSCNMELSRVPLSGSMAHGLRKGSEAPCVIRGIRPEANFGSPKAARFCGLVAGNKGMPCRAKGNIQMARVGIVRPGTKTELVFASQNKCDADQTNPQSPWSIAISFHEFGEPEFDKETQALRCLRFF